MIGLSCYDNEGEFLGTLCDVQILSSDIYTLEKDGKKIMFPVVNGVVLDVDIANKKMVVDKKVFAQIAVY